MINVTKSKTFKNFDGCLDKLTTLHRALCKILKRVSGVGILAYEQIFSDKHFLFTRLNSKVKN